MQLSTTGFPGVSNTLPRFSRVASPGFVSSAPKSSLRFSGMTEVIDAAGAVMGGSALILLIYVIWNNSRSIKALRAFNLAFSQVSRPEEVRELLKKAFVSPYPDVRAAAIRKAAESGVFNRLNLKALQEEAAERLAKYGDKLFAEAVAQVLELKGVAPQA